MHRGTGQGPAILSSAGQVGVGAIRPAPPESGPAGAVEASRTRRTGATRPKTGGVYGLRWKHPETRRTGATPPKTGGSTVCGGSPVLLEQGSGRASMGLSRRVRRASSGASRRGAVVRASGGRGSITGQVHRGQVHVD